MNAPTPEGTIEFWLKHARADWFSNSHAYEFPSVAGAGIDVGVRKNSDKTITLLISKLRPDRIVEFGALIPECGPKGLFVVVTWTPSEIKFYLNGKAVEVQG